MRGYRLSYRDAEKGKGCVYSSVKSGIFSLLCLCKTKQELQKLFILRATDKNYKRKSNFNSLYASTTLKQCVYVYLSTLIETVEFPAQ